MPFDSYSFVLIFLPVFVAVWRGAAIVHRESLGSILLVFSVLFCLWASPAALLLFAVLIPVNYAFGLVLAAPGERDGSLRRRSILALAFLCNMSPLILTRCLPLVASATGIEVQTASSALTAWLAALLPPASDGFTLETARTAGLSFWVLVQTAWLTSIYRRHIEPEGLFRHYLFSLCFPCLLAGPIVRYEQMGRQFDSLHAPGMARTTCAIALFVTGLAKKVLLADWLGAHADVIFDSVASGLSVSTSEAWMGVLSFSLQIYFDFSACMDMALGVACLCGLRLPDNFASPYRAQSFIEFWRRWHITFSAWLRDCIFTAIAGSWPGPARLFAAMAITLAVAGLWHGSNVTFLIWAGIHLFFLSVNVALRSLRSPDGEDTAIYLPVRIVCTMITFVLVTLSWVVFRSASPGDALEIYRALFAIGGMDVWFVNDYFTSWTSAVPLLTGLLAVFVLPPARSVFMGRKDGSRAWLSFRFSGTWAFVLAAALLTCLAVMDNTRPFLF